MRLLADSAEKYPHTKLTSGKMRGLAIYIHKSVAALASGAKELAMDATYGTNNAGTDLFTVLAKINGTGVPLAYLFMETLASEDGVKHIDTEATTHLLEQFLKPLKFSGFNPTFFKCDKDTSEIIAIQLVWPASTIQLCIWHTKRAIRAKLKDSNKTNTQTNYFPGDVQKLIPNLEICWGSLPMRRSGSHQYGGCQYESQSARFDQKGRIETSSITERDTVLKIFCRHYNAHPLIPDHNGTYRSSEDIHREYATEMYTWYRARNYFRLWAYLYVNWYRSGQWKL